MILPLQEKTWSWLLKLAQKSYAAAIARENLVLVVATAEATIGQCEAASNAAAAEACVKATLTQCQSLLATCRESIAAVEAIKRAVSHKLSGAEGERGL